MYFGSEVDRIKANIRKGGIPARLIKLKAIRDFSEVEKEKGDGSVWRERLNRCCINWMIG